MEELANVVDGIAERFVPEAMQREFVEAEHLSRYWWAGSIVAGKRVLDAGCGTAYGSAILARAGATEVVGVDIAGDVLEAVRSDMPPEVRLEQADILALPFEPDTFDVIVCFEVIEHVDDPEAVLDELERVLTHEGVLAISSPNRDVYPPGNPHHQHEFVPDELKETLAKRYANVQLFRQADWMTAGVFTDQVHSSESETPLEDFQMRKVVAGEVGGELYTLAQASNAPLSNPPNVATLTGAAEIKALAEAWQRLGEEHEKAAAHYRESERRTQLAEADAAHARNKTNELSARLLTIEAELARAGAKISRQEGEVEEHVRERKTLESERKALESELKDAKRIIREMQATRVWRVGTGLWSLRARLFSSRRSSS